MKNKFATITLTVLSMALIATGCGKASSTSNQNVKLVDNDVAASKCVDLPQWKDIDLTSLSSELTAEEIEQYAASTKEAKEIEGGEVQKLDTVNVDFTGTVDGKEFEGGSAEGVDVTVGSGSFIPGFEEGLVGLKNGEESEIKVTFPEDYAEELAGKEAVFTVKVNSIKRPDEITDEEREEAKAALKESKEANAVYDQQNQAWQYMTDNTKFKKLPQKTYDKYAKEYDKSLLSGGLSSIEEYLESNNIEKEQYEKDKDEYAMAQAKNDVLINALADEMDITTKSDDYKDTLSNLAKSYGMTEEELQKAYGKDTLKNYIFYQLEVEKIVAEAKVSKDTKTEDTNDKAEEKSEEKDAKDTKEEK